MRYLTSGESHGPKLDVIIDGFPSNFEIDINRVNENLAMRQIKIGSGSRQSIEKDVVIVNSGIMNKKTTGSPISFSIINKDHESWKNKEIDAFTIPRPGHADIAGVFKYNLDDVRKVLERASARGTATQVVVGSCCQQLLEKLGISIYTKVESIGPNQLQCNNNLELKYIEDEIQYWKDHGETIGGTMKTIIDGVIPGLGSYSQNDRKIDSKFAAAIIGIPAIKGVEFGSGFNLARMCGTEAQKHLGGITGGMTNGDRIEIKTVMKPIPTTITPQKTIDLLTLQTTKTRYERSDICPIFRTPIIIDSVVSYILLDNIIEVFGGDTFEDIKQQYDRRKEKFFTNKFNVNGKRKAFWDE